MDRPTREALGRLAPATKRRIRAALDALVSDPAGGKELQLELAGYRTYRVGRFRIVYRTNAMVRVVAIGPRETIYQDAARVLRPLAERRRRYPRPAT